jgi:hypothetical protein
MVMSILCKSVCMKILVQFVMYETHSLVMHAKRGSLSTCSEHSQVYTHFSQNFRGIQW